MTVVKQVNFDSDISLTVKKLLRDRKLKTIGQKRVLSKVELELF